MRTLGALTTPGLLLAAGAAAAGTIRVPEDAPTVLAAVDLAVPGDSVMIGPGTWTGRATRVIMAENGPHEYSACAYARGGVVIRGTGPGVTTLDVAGDTEPLVAGIVFVQRPGEGPLRVEGLSLTGATGTAGGWAITGLYSDGLEIQSCRFEGNRKAVSVGDCPLTMRDCEVMANTSPSSIVSASLTPIHLTRCRFEGNTGRCVQTDYDAIPPVSATFEDCQFIRNRSPGSGTALNLQHVTQYLVEACFFQENVAEVSSGAAIRASESTGTIRFSIFAYDSVYPGSASGGGVLVQGGSHEVHSNTFVGCHGGVNGGAAFTASSSAIGTFHSNVVTHSTTPAVRYVTGTTIAGSCNLFWANPAGNFGSGGAPSPTDFVADPLFCDLVARDFTVRNDSPCLFPPTPSCAPIGALGVGCGGVAIEPTSFGRVKSMFR